MISPRGQALIARLHKPGANAFFPHGLDQPFDFSAVAKSQNAFDDQSRMSVRIKGIKIILLKKWGGTGR